MPRAGLTAARLALTGAELADTLGFGQVTLSVLARHFDVSVASLYSHVANSHDLRTRIAVLALGEMADGATAAIAGRSRHEALVAFASAYRDYALRHPGRFTAASYRLDPTDDHLAAGRRNAEAIRSILRGYLLDEPDETHAVRLIGSTVRGFVELEIAGGFDHSSPDTDTSWHRILEALHMTFHGWGRRESSPTEPRHDDTAVTPTTGE
ncbi:TetR-like C-terminal domain-containing protein [Williamsia sterculiae]|uniref:Transcriptional regulator, TetR family n=1 Tax=Williamsia sterculiae TaxID=1344003 RepID=A0A1N7HCK4_9NOCA|nr:TetR-like C-terminal domain-containing protein [Williamsia sterculiae]SIS22418.1 transcriptional regulator, TetR family [Williamsia sterculiae]